MEVHLSTVRFLVKVLATAHTFAEFWDLFT